VPGFSVDLRGLPDITQRDRTHSLMGTDDFRKLCSAFGGEQRLLQVLRSAMGPTRLPSGLLAERSWASGIPHKAD
jgi:hypothetical protein